QVPPQRLMTLRIIHAALVMGCLFFAGMAVFMRQQQPAVPVDPPMVSYLGVGMALMTGMTYLFLPNMIVANCGPQMAGADEPQASSADVTGYWNILQSSFIVGAALLEGTIFFQLVAYLLEGQPWTLGVAGVFWLGLVLKFPTESGCTRWMETQRDLIE